MFLSWNNYKSINAVNTGADSIGHGDTPQGLQMGHRE